MGGMLRVGEKYTGRFVWYPVALPANECRMTVEVLKIGTGAHEGEVALLWEDGEMSWECESKVAAAIEKEAKHVG